MSSSSVVCQARIVTWRWPTTCTARRRRWMERAALGQLACDQQAYPPARSHLAESLGPAARSPGGISDPLIGREGAVRLAVPLAPAAAAHAAV